MHDIQYGFRTENSTEFAALELVMTDKTAFANPFNTYFTHTVKTSMTESNTPSNTTFKHYMNEKHTHLFCFATIDDAIISKTIDIIQPKTSCVCDGT